MPNEILPDMPSPESLASPASSMGKMASKPESDNAKGQDKDQAKPQEKKEEEKSGKKESKHPMIELMDDMMELVEKSNKDLVNGIQDLFKSKMTPMADTAATSPTQGLEALKNSGLPTPGAGSKKDELLSPENIETATQVAKLAL